MMQPSPLQLPASARLIVCERSGEWAVHLRRHVAEAGVRVWETRSLAICLDEIAESPASFVVIEVTRQNENELLNAARNWEREYPSLRWVAIADRSLAEHEWLMREAGAVHFTFSPRQADQLAHLACRHLAQIPPPPQSLTERIWASLPWGL